MPDLRLPASLPAVGRLVNQPAYRELARRFPPSLVVEAIRSQLAVERARGEAIESDARLALVSERLRGDAEPRLRHVINASGVVLHTGLGRAPLSPGAASAVERVARGYANLELDLESGRRGDRMAGVGPLLQRLTGAEAALVVNNNAAAVLLALTALAHRREVIVSRGHLVEIGGSFRMPEVMRLSGARMVEVGTTNRTRIDDYETAAGPRTGALLRVHPSNFRITGFTESPTVAELGGLARRLGVPLIDDLGSGALEATAGEPSLAESVGQASVLTLSGDKLLGGPQAGIVLGEADLVRRMARHPLARAVRADKMALVALEATLRERLLGADPSPVARMLAATPAEIRRRAGFWMVKLEERGVACRLLPGASAAGAGAMPGEEFPTVLLALTGPASKLAAALRRGRPPVLARIEGGSCCIDPRTVLRGEDEMLIDAIEAAAAGLG